MGQFGVHGLVGFSAPGAYSRNDDGPYVVGVSPRTQEPDNAVFNAKLARDPALRARVSIQRTASHGVSPGLAADLNDTPEGERPEPKMTTADVLEALHRATGMPIVADFYTRLYPADAVSLQEQSLFDTLNRLCETMRLRWNKEEQWLQFRSMTFYNDRVKEVPNRLLARWSASRQKNGFLSLEELVEIAQLPDAQLQGERMAEGIREIWGLPEWDMARNWFVLANLRFLALLTPAQRQEAHSTGGLPFMKMSLAQQQAFFTRELPGQPELHSMEDLIGTALRVDYTQPGWFEWQPVWSLRWAVRPGPGKEGKWLGLPAVRERTREAALQALRRLDPQIREAVRATLQDLVDRGALPATTAFPPEEEQIVPTRLDLVTIYIPGTAKNCVIFWHRSHQGGSDLD